MQVFESVLRRSGTTLAMLLCPCTPCLTVGASPPGPAAQCTLSSHDRTIVDAVVAAFALNDRVLVDRHRPNIRLPCRCRYGYDWAQSLNPDVGDIEQEHHACEYALRTYVRISDPKPPAVVLDRDRRIRWHVASALYVQQRRGLTRVRLSFD